MLGLILAFTLWVVATAFILDGNDRIERVCFLLAQKILLDIALTRTWLRFIVDKCLEIFETTKYLLLKVCHHQ